MHHTYTPRFVCSTKIHFDLDGDVVHNVRFDSGCDGNLKALAKLSEGQTVDYLVERLEGNDCHGRGTSCADQFVRALLKAREEEAA